MEKFQPLIDFFEVIKDDPRMRVTHISIYLALLKQWHVNGDQNPVLVERQELMSMAKINARQTYYKHMRDLHVFGYIRYYPSYIPYEASSVYLKVLIKN